MHKHRAAVRRVATDSYLILVDGNPVHQTADPIAARGLAQRLQRLFDDPRRLETVVVHALEGRYGVRSRLVGPHQEQARSVAEMTLLEISDEQHPDAWLQASVLAENLRRVLQRGSTQRQTKPEELPDVVPLTPKPHETTIQPTTTILNPSNPSPEEHLPQLDTVLKRMPTDYGSVYLFTKRYDRENVHAGLVLKERAYDLSPISHWMSWEQTTVAVVNLLKEPIPFLRIQGVVGANTVRNLYFRMDQEVPLPVLEVEGNVYEIDLDNDGNTELILVSGIPKLTIIFSWAEERFQEVNINLTLKSKSVQLNPDTKMIEAHPTVPDIGETVSPPEAEMVTYRYERDRLVKVQKGTTAT